MLHRLEMGNIVIHTGDSGYEYIQSVFRKAAEDYILQNGGTLFSPKVEDIELPENQAHVSSRNTFGKIP